MVKNSNKLNAFYKRLLAGEKLSYKRSLAIYEALYKEAVSLGVVRSRNILDGIDVDIKMAKIINSLP
jgi:hypothetical protein